MTEMVEVTVNGTYTLKLPKHRAERPEWFTEEGWESARMQSLCFAISRARWKGAKPPIDAGAPPPHTPVVYYIGAEEGDLAAICAMAGAEMYLFEPNPKAWPNIRAIWEANNLPTPTCFEGFASNVTRGVTARYMPSDQWPKSADENIVGNHGFKELHLEAEHYNQLRLDDLFDHGVSPPDIITFDVEGSEWQVLKGAEHTLREHKPVIFASIHPEFMIQHWGQYSADFRRWIKDFGYKEHILDYQHELHTMYVPT